MKLASVRPLKTLPVSVSNLALKIAKGYEDTYNEYLLECEQDRAAGYRPHYCEHGTNAWTDYDNICGPCEDGYSMGDGVQRRARAIAEAKKRYERAIFLVRLLNDKEYEGLLNEDAIWAKVGKLMNLNTEA